MSNDIPLQRTSSAEREHLLHLLRNSPPPDQIPQLIPELDSIQSKAAIQLQILDPEISILKARLHVLEQHRADWFVHQSRCQSLLAPIRSLPVELLELVFKYLFLYDDDQCRNFHLAHKPLALVHSVSGVCNHWRGVALACPQLWTSIELHGLASSYVQEVVLPRTMQCGLDVALFYDDEHERTFISLHSHLIQRLLIAPIDDNNHINLATSPHGWANLTQLYLEPYNNWCYAYQEFAIAPRLHTIKFTSQVDVSASTLPWAQIRRLTIEWVMPDQLQHIIPKSSNLEVLTLDMYECLQDSHHASELFPVVSPSLHTLESIASLSYTDHWSFEFFTLPALHTMHLKRDPPSNLNSDHVEFSAPLATKFYAFLQRSQCQILVVSISNISLSSKHLVDFLRLIPTLQEFTLVQVYANMPLRVDEEFIYSLSAAHETDIVPKLKSLTLNLVSIPETPLMTAVSSRWHQTANRVSGLEFVSVIVTEQVFDAAAIDPIVQLRAGGLRLILQDTSTRY